VVFTKPFYQGDLAFEEAIPARDDWHRYETPYRPLGEIRRVDVRLEDGNFVRNVPVDFFKP
jgi:hypothetical protein